VATAAYTQKHASPKACALFRFAPKTGVRSLCRVHGGSLFGRLP
jgi:hypothetical protein